MKPSTVIEASTRLLALHSWPEAPQSRAYLRYPHAHNFQITAWAEVSHGDRDIEFHDFLSHLEQAVSHLGRIKVNDTGNLPDLGRSSCEQIGEFILDRLPQAFRVRVAEDDLVAATVDRISGPRLGLADPGSRYEFTVYRERPKVVTLCGSTRFKTEFLEAEARFEREGVAVFSVGYFAHADGIPISEEEKVAADELHKWKIRMSDEIFVVNPGGYIGESTRSEIAYASEVGVPVRYLVEPGEQVDQGE